MQEPIDSHRETALESPYSRDRQEAIDALAELYPTADEREQRRILETLRTTASEATGRSERELARETLQSLCERDPSIAASIAVPFFCTLAEEGTTSSERLDAIDALRELYPDVEGAEQERIGQALAEIGGNATYEDERRRARQRLRDVTTENRGGSDVGTVESGSSGNDNNAINYLGVSLAEHLENAADESPQACQQRATELRDFLVANPVTDAAYDEIAEDVNALVEQLEVVPTDGALADDRRDRVCELATRVRRLYERSR